MQSGTIFDIKGFALNDGPGIRTTVFMKGCPLRCLWCHNPAGLSPEPELYVKQGKCTRCGKCMTVCGHEDCRPYGRCLHICPNGALSVCGSGMTSEELAKRLLRDRDVYEMSGGGVTFSGGEPLMQSSFILEVLEYLGGKYHVMLDSSGYGKYTDLLALAQQCDLIAFGIKLLNAEPAQKFTGQDGGCICRNIARLDKTGTVPYYFRIPLVPGVTDTEENFRALYEFAAPLKNLQYLEFLPYNQAAGAKYAALNLPDSASRWANRSADPIPEYIKNSFEIIEHK
jgi:pyruvate formate lyase activating enzyme